MVVREAPLEPLPDEARKGDTLGSGRFGEGSAARARPQWRSPLIMNLAVRLC